MVKLLLIGATQAEPWLKRTLMEAQFRKFS